MTKCGAGTRVKGSLGTKIGIHGKRSDRIGWDRIEMNYIYEIMGAKMRVDDRISFQSSSSTVNFFFFRHYGRRQRISYLGNGCNLTLSNLLKANSDYRGWVKKCVAMLN